MIAKLNFIRVPLIRLLVLIVLGGSSPERLCGFAGKGPKTRRLVLRFLYGTKRSRALV